MLLAEITDDLSAFMLGAIFSPDSSPWPRHGSMIGRRPYWICQFLGWGGLVIGLSVSGVANDPGLYRRIWILDWLAFGLAGLLASHLLRWLLSLSAARGTGPRLVRWALTRLCLAITVMWLIRGLLVQRIEPSPYNAPQWTSPLYLIEIAVVLSAWAALYFAFDYYRRYEAGVHRQLRTEAALKESQLQLLRSQINPHFLFNSLNTVRALIPVEQSRSRDAVSLLAGLLRVSLSADRNSVIPLVAELQLADDYLALQQIRFENRLVVRRKVEPATLALRIPPFVVQGLLENAIKHGIARFEQGGDIEVSAWIGPQGLLRIAITNPGQLNPRPENPGLGIANIRERLSLLYGSAGILTLKQLNPSSVVAELTIPQPAQTSAS